MSFDRTRDSAPAFEISTLSPSLARAEPIVAMMRFVLCIVVDDINVISRVEEVESIAGCFEHARRFGIRCI